MNKFDLFQNITINWKSLTFQFLMALFIVTLAPHAIAAKKITAFDHEETTFPLDINHTRVSCENCHINGIFQGTPRKCYSCHSVGSNIQASAPSFLHIRTTKDCEFCHQSRGWFTVAKVDHFVVIGSCQNCHNGIVAAGKNIDHLQSSVFCDDCHTTITWSDARFDHNNIFSGCISCHNGTSATGKFPEHILSTSNCEDCHRTISWTPLVRMDHNAAIGTCSSCHNGVSAEGKHPEHLATALECGNCHTTSGWKPAN
jgi:hypothetical protein